MMLPKAGLAATSMSFPVPLLVGMDIKDPKIVTQHLRAGGFKLAVKKHEKNAKVLKNKIISQEPMAGSIVKNGATIMVVVSDGR